MLHRHLLVDSEQVARFVREARVVASIESDHVVRVLEVASESSPVPFLAMERLFGRDLADVMRSAPLTAFEVVSLVADVASGIAAAHAAGIVHRDLKPQNVFRVEGPGRAPAWKVLDFGLSKLTEQTSSLTRGQVVGTPAYMAPEQARGADVDARADVYALAAIAYRAITGHPPFSGQDIVAVLLEVVMRMPVRPRVFVRELPDDVERALLLGLAKDPADRWQTVGDFAAGLAAAFEGKLDAATRARAAAVLAKYPWGERAQTQISPAARSLAG
jgi:serine/threonine-protein kinase